MTAKHHELGDMICYWIGSMPEGRKITATLSVKNLGGICGQGLSSMGGVGGYAARLWINS